MFWWYWASSFRPDTSTIQKLRVYSSKFSQFAKADTRLSRGVAQPGSALAWGARGRVFESLRPDHIIQRVARFYLATLFYFSSFLPLQNHWLWVDPQLIQTPEFVPEGTSSTSMRPVRPSGRTHVYAELSVLDQLIVALKSPTRPLLGLIGLSAQTEVFERCWIGCELDFGWSRDSRLGHEDPQSRIFVFMCL